MPHWITQPAELDSYLHRHPTRIGLDTEFIRERTYWPRLALVQIAIDCEILLVDPLAPGIAEALQPWLISPDIVKVMHSASEDLITFKCTCGVLPRPLFDTQIAAALTGIGTGLGYQKLVHELTDTLLAKGETRSDWLRRPLSSAQLEYAADDVRYLFALHDTLGARLQQQNRADWQVEDSERLLTTAEHDEPDRWPHLAMRSAQFLERDAQLRLLRLLRWRDQQARQSDKPRSWILDNELAVALARNPLADEDALQHEFKRHPKAPRKLAGAVWQALSTASGDEADAPLARTAQDGHKATLKRLQDAVAAQSRELGLPDGVLASRRQLESLIESGQWPAALGGWRRQQLESRLMPLLATSTG